MSELTCLELSVLLWVVHMFCQVLTNRGEFGDPYSFSSRDEQPTPKGLACGRAARAFRNYVENLVPFVAVDLALIATHHTGGVGAIGATLWIVGRIVYLPIYLLGINYVRTVAWLVAIIGLLMMLWRLAGY